jgi:HTH-type transcriptional regulator, sugar sensing transcriptional regulator
MNPNIERQMQKLGLSEKEARVYLASLELGASPVQDMARRAGVNRATTYVMIESLTQRGLMTSFEQGKKRLFVAETPDRLLSILRVRAREIEEQEREFRQVLPDLRSMLAASGERPRVRFFEGAEGLRAIRDEVLATDATEMLAVMDASDRPVSVLTDQENAEYDRKLREKGIRGKMICSDRHNSAELRQKHPHWDFRCIVGNELPFTGEVTTFGNKIFAFTQTGKFIGVIIESEELAKTMHSILMLAWSGARQLAGIDRTKLPDESPAY